MNDNFYIAIIFFIYGFYSSYLEYWEKKKLKEYGFKFKDKKRKGDLFLNV